MTVIVMVMQKKILSSCKISNDYYTGFFYTPELFPDAVKVREKIPVGLKRSQTKLGEVF